MKTMTKTDEDYKETYEALKRFDPSDPYYADRVSAARRSSETLWEAHVRLQSYRSNRDWLQW